MQDSVIQGRPATLHLIPSSTEVSLRESSIAGLQYRSSQYEFVTLSTRRRSTRMQEFRKQCQQAIFTEAKQTRRKKTLIQYKKRQKSHFVEILVSWPRTAQKDNFSGICGVRVFFWGGAGFLFFFWIGVFGFLQK